MNRAIFRGFHGADSMLRAVVLSACSLWLILACTGTVRSDQSSTPQEALRSDPPNAYALTGARVFVSPDKVLENATILVRNGKIEAVGDLRVPADARELSFAGRTVYPGFIDAYSEQSTSSDRLQGSARYWNGQVTPQLSTADQIAVNKDWNAVRQQGIVAQLIAPADGVIRGWSAVVSTSGSDVNSSLLAKDVAQHLQLTVTNRSRTGYPGSPMGAVSLARQALYDAQWYRDARAAVAAQPELALPEQNDALEALQPVLTKSVPIIISASDEQFALRADQFAAEFGLSLIIKGSGREYRRLGEIAAARRPLILPLAFPKPPNVATLDAAQDATLESLLHWDFAPENPARVDAAGIQFAFCTDRLESESDFLKSLRKAVERGLAPESALRALTITPAQLLGLSDQLGTLESGRLASFVVTDGELFDTKTKVVETWVSGQRFEHSPRQGRDAEGHYQLQIQQMAGFPGQLYLEITRTDDKLRGRVSRQPIPKPIRKAEESTSSPVAESNSDANAEDSSPSAESKDNAPDAAGNKIDTSDNEIMDLGAVDLNDTALSAKFSGKSWGFDGIVRLALTLTETAATTKERPVAIGSIVWPDGSRAITSAVRVDPPAAEEKSGEGESAKAGEEKKSKPATFEITYPPGGFGRKEIPNAAKLTAFVHATLWTCGPDGVIEDGTLVVADGKIIEAGSDITIPDGAEVIDVRGMHITPGIIDCHSHMATDGGVNESTQAITCEVRIGDFVDANDVTIYRQLAGGVTAANILHGSANPIGGQNQVVKLRWGHSGEGLKFSEAPQGVKFALGENVKQSNWTDANGRYPQTRMGVEQLYRDSFEAARDYARKMDAWKTEQRGLPPRRDLELDALREVLEGHRWIHCHSYRQDEILALLRILKEYEITIGTFQHILEGYKVADEMAKAGAMASAFSDWWAYKFEVQDAIPHAGALMHKQGIVVSFNSDDGELARHLNQEAAKAVKYGGVPREEALKFVTLNPAKQLRIDHLVGSLEASKHADFVIWNGDPLSNFSRCEQTWIDGRRYFSRDDDDRMQKESFEKRNTLIQKILESGEEMREPGERDFDPAALWPRQDEFCHHFSHQRALKVQE
jgi:imidazolonepropionase-like amidohydrolase